MKDRVPSDGCPRETAIDWDRRSIQNKYLGAHMIHARVLFPEYPSQVMLRERRIWKGVAAERPSFGRRAALAAEMLVNFDGISKDHCLVHCLRAPISR
jgi:hypothetical protein